MKFRWQTAPYSSAASAQFCDVPGVGRLLARRLVKGRRRFGGMLNGRRAIEETRTISDAKSELEKIARRIAHLRQQTAEAGVPAPIDVRKEGQLT